MTTVQKIKACAVAERGRFSLKHNVFRMEYNGVRYIMTAEQAANGTWKRESQFVEVVW